MNKSTTAGFFFVGSCGTQHLEILTETLKCFSDTRKTGRQR
jgi:hypothetical protein